MSMIATGLVLRGVSDTNLVKNAREQLRAVAETAKNDPRRHNAIFDNPLKNQRLVAKRPVISVRGGDLRNIVQEGRKKAQFNKAFSVFTAHTAPINHKVSHAFG